MVSHRPGAEEVTKVNGREQRGERTARALIQAARTAFADRGYSGASVRDVAREADANPALVRYHFGSKEGLYYRVIDEEMSSIRDALAEGFETGDTLEERLSNMLEAYMRYVSDNPEFPKLMLRASLDNDEGALHIAQTHLQPLRETISRATQFVETTELGSVTDVSWTIFAAALFPYIYGPIVQAIWGEEFLSEEHLAQHQDHLAALLNMMLEKYRATL